MKKLVCMAAIGFCSLVSAQETMDRLEQQPQPVTQSQVEKDARQAQEERKRNDEALRRSQEETKTARKEENTTAKTTNSRTSNSPGKQ